MPVEVSSSGARRPASAASSPAGAGAGAGAKSGAGAGAVLTFIMRRWQSALAVLAARSSKQSEARAIALRFAMLKEVAADNATGGCQSQ